MQVVLEVLVYTSSESVEMQLSDTAKYALSWYIHLV